MVWTLAREVCTLSHSGFPLQATEREIRCLRVWLSVLQLPLLTFSLQSGVSKPREFNLSPVHTSKLALKSAYVCLKAFMGIGKEVGKGVCQEVVLCCTHLHVRCSAVLLHHCCLFSCRLPCSQTTYLSLLGLILEWLLLSALEILRKFEENCLFSSSYLLLLQFSQVKFNGGVCCLPAKICVTLTYCVVPSAIYTALFCLLRKCSTLEMSRCVKAAQPSVNCV